MDEKQSLLEKFKSKYSKGFDLQICQEANFWIAAKKADNDFSELHIFNVQNQKTFQLFSDKDNKSKKGLPFGPLIKDFVFNHETHILATLDKGNMLKLYDIYLATMEVWEITIIELNDEGIESIQKVWKWVNIYTDNNEKAIIIRCTSCGRTQYRVYTNIKEKKRFILENIYNFELKKAEIIEAKFQYLQQSKELKMDFTLDNGKNICQIVYISTEK